MSLSEWIVKNQKKLGLGLGAAGAGGLLYATRDKKSDDPIARKIERGLGLKDGAFDSAEEPHDLVREYWRKYGNNPYQG